jgi:hypothetical protein
MKKHNNSNGTNRMLEAYYECIGEAHIENIIDELNEKKDEIDKIEVPESLDKWFYDFVEKDKKSKDRKKLLNRIKLFSRKAAVILLILISAMSALVFSVEAVRVRVLNFFMERNDKYTEVRINEETFDNLTPNFDWENYYQPNYMPEGYFFESAKAIGTLKVLKYTDGENQITLTQANTGTDFQLDTENAILNEIYIDGNPGQLIIKEDKIILFWYNQEASFNIIGHVDKDEIVTIAESMKKNKK